MIFVINCQTNIVVALFFYILGGKIEFDICHFLASYIDKAIKAGYTPCIHFFT